MAFKPRSLIFVTTENGCYIPLTHQLNQDGYFRKRWSNGFEMFHRFIWRAKQGEIPEGYEINHLCGCRACSNIDHLECIPGKEHTIKTNKERYAHIQDAAKKTWKDEKDATAKLVKEHGEKAYHWVRKWKQERV